MKYLKKITKETKDWYFPVFYFLLLLLLLLLLLIIIIIIIIVIIPWEFFTSALADGFLLEFEWQQVSSSLRDSSQYSNPSQKGCSMDSLHLCHYYQVLHSLYQSLVTVWRAGGARCVMVIVVGKDTATRVQIQYEADCISHSTNTLGKDMNPLILPPLW